jgi:hypothetical protein
MISLLPFLTIIQARSIPQTEPPQTGIKWSPCPQALNAYDPYNRTFQCGTLDVPLDYTDKSSSAKLGLNIIKIPALKQPKRGSILFNWGGPGGGGVMNMASSSADVQR